MTTLTLATRHLLGLAWRCDPRRLLRAGIMVALGFLATPLIALCLKGIITDSLDREAGAALLLGLCAAVLLVVELMMNHFAHLSYFELGDLAEVELHNELIGLAHGTPGLDRLEDPAHADLLALIRENLPRTRSSLEAVLQLGGLALQTALTTVLLALLTPWLLLLPLAGFLPVLAGNRAQAIIDRSKERCAARARLGRHLLELSTTYACAKEIRLAGAAGMLIDRHRRDWEQVTRELRRAQLAAAALRACGQLAFALAYATAIWLVVGQAHAGGSSLGDVILVITLAAQVSFQVSTALRLLSVLQDNGRTAQWLREVRAEAASHRPPADPAPVPAGLTHGIRLEHVSFAYPGSAHNILEDVCLEIPAGSAVALVGENGAGKTTLVKLLCGLYRPTAGRILVDGVDLARIDLAGWQRRVATLFQDFGRLELRLRENIGIGDLERIEDDSALHQVLAAADAADLVAERISEGLDGFLGRAYADGAELSGGQWQKLGLARTLLRRNPLIVALDEPASALDATAEHALFSRFGRLIADARDRTGAVSLLVSHRFSTVRMADLIVVLEQGRVSELGTHEQLVDAQGLYAELYQLQARVYA